MKILVVPSWYPTPEKKDLGIFIQKHAQLIAEDHEVTVLYFDYHTPGNRGWVTFSDTTENNIRLLRIQIKNLKFPLAGIVKWKLTILSYWYYILFKKKVKYDCINLNVVYHIGIFLFPFLMMSKKPLVITEHWTGYFDEDGTYKKLGSVTRMMFTKLFKKAKTVIAISNSIKNRLDYLFHTAYKTVVIPNVLNVPDSPRPVSGLDPNHFDFLVISNFDNRQKGLTGILDAFAEVSKTHPQVRLTMAGNGDDFEMVKAHAKALGLTNKQVIFLGRVNNNEVPELYKKAHCYILNSRFETFSISTAEALLHGVPVIATRCNGPEEYVNERCGKLVNFNDYKSLKITFEYMLDLFTNFDSMLIHEEIKEKYCFGYGLKFVNVFNYSFAHTHK